MSSDEKHLLQTLHRLTGVPDGQFPQRPAIWRKLTDDWNEATGRDDTPEDILHYIMNQRKNALWFRFEGKHKPLRVPDSSMLTSEQWEVVDALYVEMGVAADNFLIDRKQRLEFLRGLTARTGEHIPDLVFVAALIARRKGGSLPPVPAPNGPDTGMGFGDINQVG